MTEERWVPVEGYEDYYEVSDHGRVRRALTEGNTQAGRLLKPYLSPMGYYLVTLCRNNVKFRCTVHGLVAHAFLGPRPEGLVVNHKDLVKTNNHADNFEYITQSENLFHAYRDPATKAGRRWNKPTPKRGAEHHCAKLTAEKALAIYQTAGEPTILAERYGVSIGTIYDIRRGKSWRHVTGAPRPTPKRATAVKAVVTS